MILRAAWAVALALLSIAAAPPPAIEVRNANDPKSKIEARAELDASTIRLSGEVKLTLTVNAPGPLSVTVPKPLVTRPNQWRVRDEGLPLREILPGGRERWTQIYHLSPLIAGDPKVALGSLVVRAGDAPDLSIAWDDEKLPTIHVVTSIENPSIDSLRPPTDIEPMPPEPIIEHSSTSWLFAIVPVLLIISAISIVLGRRQRRPAAPRNAAWAQRELASETLTADRCANVLRQYLAFRFGVPAEFQTTPELATGLEAEDRMSVDAAAEWQALLIECDAARFSGTAASVAGIADRGLTLVHAAESHMQKGHEEKRKGTKS